MNSMNTTENDARNLPLSALRVSPENARRTYNAVSIEALAASIRHHRLIQNLVVVESAEEVGAFEVVAGGRRLRALQLLLNQGVIAGDYPVACIVRDRSEATGVSLTENVQREAMHPADEYDAFLKLTQQGMTVDQIADAHGVTPLVVERRLSLAKAAPELIELFRTGEITNDQLIALCSTDDHARQIEVWNSAPSWNQSASYLRSLIVGGEVDASKDRRVRFIGGVGVYEAAGGVVRRDLFSNSADAGFLTDAALLERLVAEKLEAAADDVRAEGWAWVEVSSEFNYGDFYRFGRVQPQDGELSDEDTAAVATLEAEAERLQAEQAELERASDDDYTDEESDRLEQIEDRLSAISDEIDAIKSEAAFYSDESKAHAGAWVAMYDGALRIERGLVKSEDRKAVKDAGAEVEGGRETKSAGRKTDAISDALRRSLLGRRNHAAQLALAKAVREAKVVQAYKSIELVNRSVGEGIPSDLCLRDGYGGARTHHPVVGADAEQLAEQLGEYLAELTGKLPRSGAELFDKLTAMDDATLDAINACGTAFSLSLHEGHKGLTAKVLDSIGFDPSQHITITADNYFGRVPKPLIIAALKEVGASDDADALEKMKKGELASEAERRVAGTGWLPKLIRSPGAKKAEKKADAPKAAKPAAKKAAKATKKAKA